MKMNTHLDVVMKSLENLSDNKIERSEMYSFISQNLDQFYEISERMVGEVKNIKDTHPDNWKEMVAMTMFSTI